MAARALLAARRVAAVAPLARSRAMVPMTPVRMMGGAAHGDAHGDHGHDHHDHRVFELPYDVMGAPLGIFSFVVFGGAGVLAIAWYKAMHSWVRPVEEADDE